MMTDLEKRFFDGQKYLLLLKDKVIAGKNCDLNFIFNIHVKTLGGVMVSVCDVTSPFIDQCRL